MEPNDSIGKCSFENVLEAELKDIAKSRKLRAEKCQEAGEKDAPRWPVDIDENLRQLGSDPPPHAVCRLANDADLVGLALSGGGIRSATFNLGVLQAIAELKILRLVDYISTVSGGGYIGSWLTAWAKREGSIISVENNLSSHRHNTGATAPEHPSIRFLRRFSNYLTPKLGAFTADMWMLISTYLRNLSLNLAVLVFILIGVMLLPETAVVFFKDCVGNASVSIFYIATALLFLIGMTVIHVNIESQYSNAPLNPPLSRYTKQLYILTYVVPATICFSISSSLILVRESVEVLERKSTFLLIIYVLYLVSWLTAIYLIKYYQDPGWSINKLRGIAVQTFARATQIKDKRMIAWQIAGMLVAIILGSLFVRRLVILLADAYNAYDPYQKGYIQHWYILMWGMPGMILVLMIAATVQIGVLGRDMPERSHEWWSRLGGIFIIVMLAWIFLFGISLYGPSILEYVSTKFMVIVGAIISASGIIAGKSSATNGRDLNGVKKVLLEIVAKTAPYAFVIVILLAISFITNKYVLHFDNAINDKVFDAFVGITGLDKLKGSYLFQHVYLAVGFASLAVLLSWRIDVNTFSMNPLYKNRLTRCYLGASNRDRRPDDFTKFDPDDDMPLSALTPSSSAGSVYDGPYPIINATLNLVSGKELAWQERKGASFIFTPIYSGYQISGEGCYRPTREYAMNGKKSSDSSGVTLGSAMSISGAAATPNMGYHSSPSLAFLMTIFNVRLGWWCGNPAHERAWKSSGPKCGLFFLLSELLGKTDAEHEYVYISDGGHFENLAVYELVRRRCKYIIVSDAGQDKDLKFGDLGNVIRKCYADMGIEIEIDISRIKRSGDGKYSESSFAVGTIHYEKINPHLQPGVLVYLKPTLTGKEPTDIKEYAAIHDKYPHQPTSNQWFDESQFESYRKLGYHIAMKTFG